MRNHLSKKNWKLILLGLGMLTLALVVTGCAFFFLMIRRPPRSTPKPSSAASDVYKRQP